MDRITTFQDEGGEWRWHRVAPNNEIISEGEGHTSQADAKRAAERANQDSNWYHEDERTPLDED